MRFSRLLPAAFALAALALTSGCAVNRATASVDGSADLGALKTINVVHIKEDERRVDKLITEKLNKIGFVATSSDAKRSDVDANLTYIDRWYWDITMYMIELTIVVRDGKTDFPLARGNSLHSSLTRRSPQEMVDEVTANIFKEVKK
ncbi:MAG: hypothetical protein M3Z16_08625 [Pseudomonadota bacterium]|nr:hypothetical protein [Pseudomonadota bacterium]